MPLGANFFTSTGGPVEGQRAQCHLLALAPAEFVEVEVDRVRELDGQRIIDDGLGMASLVGPAVEGQQRGFRNPGQRTGVDSAVVWDLHHSNATRRAMHSALAVTAL